MEHIEAKYIILKDKEAVDKHNEALMSKYNMRKEAIQKAQFAFEQKYPQYFGAKAVVAPNNIQTEWESFGNRLEENEEWLTDNTAYTPEWLAKRKMKIKKKNPSETTKEEHVGNTISSKPEEKEPWQMTQKEYIIATNWETPLEKLNPEKSLASALIAPNGKYYYFRGLPDTHQHHDNLFEKNYIRKSTGSGMIDYQVYKLNDEAIKNINNDIVSIPDIDDRGVWLNIVSEGKSYDVPPGVLNETNFNIKKAIQSLRTELYKDIGSDFSTEVNKSVRATIHKNIVRQAIGLGKHIPERVLADYPNLKKQNIEHVE